jgi:uridine phosphorylase
MQTNGKMHHIRMSQGEVGRYVFLPGDPGRCEKIADHFDTPVLVAQNREYTTYTGFLDGEKVSVTSTGVGSPSAAIAVEELTKIGADTFIRVGTSGGMQPVQRPGELAIVTAAIRDEGTSRQYMPLEFPAIADLDIVTALRDAAESLGHSYRLGVTQSKDSFYGQHEPNRMPTASQLKERWAAWKLGGAICSEMEASTIFILASILRLRAGGIMLVAGNQESDDPRAGSATDLGPLIETSIRGVRILIERDRGG